MTSGTKYPGSGRVVDEYSDGSKVERHVMPDINSEEFVKAAKRSQADLKSGGVQAREFADSVQPKSNRGTQSAYGKGGIKVDDFLSGMRKKQSSEKSEKDANE